MASQLNEDDSRGDLREIDPVPEETTPLLGRSDASESPSPTSSSLRFSALAFILTLVTLTTINSSLVTANELRLLKMGVCREYYRVHDPSVIGPPPLSYIDESLCNIYDIAIPAIMLQIRKAQIGIIPGILFAILYGRLSDRRGRKPVLFLGILGQALAYFWTLIVCYFHQAFDTRLVLLSPAFFIIGGGSRVMYAVAYSAVVDVVPEGMRTTVFYLVGAAPFICDSIMTRVEPWLVSKDLWLPFHFGSIVMILAIVTTLFMPETSAVERPASSTEVPEAPVETGSETQTRTQKIVVGLRDSLKSAKSTLGVAWSTRELRFTFLILFLFMFNSTTGIQSIYREFLLDRSPQFVEHLVLINETVTLGVLLALVLLSQFLQRRLGVRSLLLDVNVVRAISIMLCLAGLLMGIGLKWSLLTGYVLTTVGCGLYQAAQSLLAAYGDRTRIGQLYATAAVVDLVARTAGTQTYLQLFDWAWTCLWSWGHWRSALPFAVVSVLNVLMAYAAFLLLTQT